MSNPITDQYAATVRDKRAEGADSYLLAVADNFAKAITRHVPNHDPKVIGEILLHAGAGIAGIAIGLHEEGVPEQQIIASMCNTFTIAGAALYSPEQEIPDV